MRETFAIRVYRGVYRGALTYYLSMGCCDKPNLLYDRCGTGLCAPDGGFSGTGDGRCPDYFDEGGPGEDIWPRGPSGP